MINNIIKIFLDEKKRFLKYSKTYDVYIAQEFWEEQGWIELLLCAEEQEII